FLRRTAAQWDALRADLLDDSRTRHGHLFRGSRAAWIQGNHRENDDGSQRPGCVAGNAEAVIRREPRAAAEMAQPRTVARRDHAAFRADIDARVTRSGGSAQAGVSRRIRPLAYLREPQRSSVGP